MISAPCALQHKRDGMIKSYRLFSFVMRDSLTAQNPYFSSYSSK